MYVEKNNAFAYPSSEAIGYAVWLKHLALRLPAYAARYELTADKILEMHCLALDFIDLLICRMQSATTHIYRHKCLAVGKAPLAEQLCWEASASFRHQSVEALVAYMQQHPAYSAADAHELRLPTPA